MEVGLALYTSLSKVNRSSFSTAMRPEMGVKAAKPCCIFSKGTLRASPTATAERAFRII